MLSPDCCINRLEAELILSLACPLLSPQTNLGALSSHLALAIFIESRKHARVYTRALARCTYMYYTMYMCVTV